MLAFHAAHSIHTPLETLPDAFEHFAFIEDSEDRRAYHSMVWNVDRDIGKIVAALKSKGMYQNSLVVLSADNGGPVYMSGRGGGNNFPLRGVCQNIDMVEQKLLPFSIKLTQSLMY
jgi:arylsulfatase B